MIPPRHPSTHAVGGPTEEDLRIAELERTIRLLEEELARMKAKTDAVLKPKDEKPK